MIAIHNNDSEDLFHYRWVKYCQQNGIDFKRVNCYEDNIIDQLADCDALMWHFHQNNPADLIFAKQLLFAIEHAGKFTFPDCNTSWTFDDKVAQKYLLEAINVDFVSTHIFYNKACALNWVKNAEFPVVFKLRGGASSKNVKLIKDRTTAIRFISKAFGNGFNNYDAYDSLKERFRKYRNGIAPFSEVLKGVVRFFIPPPYTKVIGKEYGYFYFQEFIPENKFDIRIVVIGDKAFGIRRMVRENDFRASGSGYLLYERDLIDERCVKISFNVLNKLKAQCLAFDFVFDRTNKPLIVEISFGFSNKGYDACTGYWDSEMNWHNGSFDPYGWMVELIQNNINSKIQMRNILLF